MSKVFCTIGAAVLALTVATTPALAKITTFTALLNAGQETPPNTTTGSGVAFFAYDKDTDTLTYSVTVSGLSSPESAAHIHGPALPGVPAGIVVGLGGVNPDNGSISVFSTLDSGNALKELKKGLLYVNVHTTLHSGGEIRGQILPSSK